MDHNPFLAPGRRPHDDKGSEAGIEQLGAVENIAAQTRPAPPTAAENALADALQAVFADDIDELPRIVERLNASGPPPTQAERWSEASLRAALHRLGR